MDINVIALFEPESAGADIYLQDHSHDLFC